MPAVLGSKLQSSSWYVKLYLCIITRKQLATLFFFFESEGLKHGLHSADFAPAQACNVRTVNHSTL